jgi:hypothetical protein
MVRMVFGLALAAVVVVGPGAAVVATGPGTAVGRWRPRVPVGTVARRDASRTRPTAVALGDSFISGEGGRWLGNGSEPFGTRSGTDRAAFDCDGWGVCRYDPARVYGASEADGCHRSDVAPIRSAPLPPGIARVNLAGPRGDCACRDAPGRGYAGAMRLDPLR